MYSCSLLFIHHDYRHCHPSHKVQSQGTAQNHLGLRASPGKTTRTHRYVVSIVSATITDLAAPDKKVRDAAFANVIDFLSNGGITQLLAPIEDAGGVIPRTAEEESQDVRRGQLPPLEMRRLWKGLFYCTLSFPSVKSCFALTCNRLLDVRQAARTTTTCIGSLLDHPANQPAFHDGWGRRGRGLAREGYGCVGFHRGVLGSDYS